MLVVINKFKKNIPKFVNWEYLNAIMIPNIEQITAVKEIAFYNKFGSPNRVIIKTNVPN